jgi:alkylmercury lyase
MTENIKNDRMKNSEKDNEVEQAVDKILTDFYENLTPDQLHIIGQTWQRLAANGSPVSPDEIAIRVQTSPDKAASTLRKFGAEFDKRGNILGFGLTLVTTPHIYEANGHKLYTWCAADALYYPVILKQTASIESSDPVTGEKIQISVTPDRLEKIEPESAVVSFIKSIDLTDVRGTFCNNVNFFSSPETATEWIAEHPNMTFYPASNVYQALKHIHLNKYRDDMVQSSKQEERRMCC